MVLQCDRGTGLAYDILVVEDDPDMLQMLSVVLNEEGYGVRQARDCGEAARLAEERAPDLVLLDLLLPLENGISLAEQLKSGACSEVPIIAMSTSDPMLARARAQNCFEGWLPKPFNLQTLLHYVATAGEG
jgi:DNA-binding response OmpR family regulator